MLDASVHQAQQRGVADAKITVVAADSTGLNSSGRSEYYGKRSGLKKRDFPKVSQIVDIQSHLTLASIGERGPSPDDPVFHELATQAHACQPFKGLLADPGYDAEHHHRFLREKLGVLSVIPPLRGRPAKAKPHIPGGFWRGFLHKHWPNQLYGQRWQVETRFSMEKRKLGPGLRSRLDDAQDAEMFLRTLTLNLMLEPPES